MHRVFHVDQQRRIEAAEWVWRRDERRGVYQTRIQSMSMAAGKLPRAGSPPPGPPTARVNMGESQ